MADKVEKPKKSRAKPKKDEQGVLAALPSTRPERIGARRATAPKTKSGAKTAGRAPATTAAKSSRAKSSPKKKAAAGKSSSYPRTSAAAKGATATRRKAAAPRTFEPTTAAESAAGAADERAAGAATPPRPAPEPRPRPVREGAPGMGTTSPDREQPSAESGRPSGVELVTTAVQAAGELTQIGLTIGGRIVKRAVDRLPKP